MLNPKLPFTKARKRLVWRLALTLFAALVLASGAFVGRRAGRSARSGPPNGAATRAAAPRLGAFRPDQS